MQKLFYYSNLLSFDTLFWCLGTNSNLCEAFWPMSGKMGEKHPGVVETLAIVRPGFIPAYSLGLIFTRSSLSAS